MSIGWSQSHDLSLGEIFISLINVYFSHKSKVYQLSWINFLSAFRPSWVNLTSVKIIIIVLWWDYLRRVELFVILICNIMLWHYCKMDWITSQMVSEIYPKNWMMLSNGVHNAIQYIQCCTSLSQVWLDHSVLSLRYTYGFSRGAWPLRCCWWKLLCSSR